MTTIMLRLSDVLARRGATRSRLYAAIKQGTMVPPIRRANSILAVWPAHEIETINRAEIAGASAEELCALVRQLVEQRRQMRPAIVPSVAAGQRLVPSTTTR